MGEERFAGIDWASEKHAVCVVDEQGRIAEGRRARCSGCALGSRSDHPREARVPRAKEVRRRSANMLVPAGKQTPPGLDVIC